MNNHDKFSYRTNNSQINLSKSRDLTHNHIDQNSNDKSYTTKNYKSFCKVRSCKNIDSKNIKGLRSFNHRQTVISPTSWHLDSHDETKLLGHDTSRSIINQMCSTDRRNFKDSQFKNSIVLPSKNSLDQYDQNF